MHGVCPLQLQYCARNKGVIFKYFFNFGPVHPLYYISAYLRVTAKRIATEDRALKEFFLDGKAVMSMYTNTTYSALETVGYFLITFYILACTSTSTI